MRWREPRCPDWHSEMLTTMLQKIAVWQHFIAVHFLGQLNCSFINQKAFKNTHNRPGGESNAGRLSDSQRYLPLYYRGLLLTDICCSWSPEPTEMCINKIKSLSTADILSPHAVNRTAVSWLTFADTNHKTTENCCLATFIAIHFMSQLNYSLIKQKVFKSTHNLPGGESNPGLLRDSQRYLPLYYRGLLFSKIYCSSFPEPTEMFINKIKSLSTADILSRAGNRTPVFWLTVRDTNHYTTEECCSAAFIAVHFLSQLKCSFNKIKGFQKLASSPRRGIEHRCPEWQSQILTTILRRIVVDCDLLQFISWSNWNVY